MTVPPLIAAEGTILSVRPTPATTPWTPDWWQNSIITRVPETSVGWLVAQGWQVQSTFTEETNGQSFYTMTRQSMQSWVILQTLLSEYIWKYNEANLANVLRYENIIDLWNETIQKTREQMDVQGNVSDGHFGTVSDVNVTTYFGQLNTLVNSVESEMALALTSATSSGDTVAEQLAAYLVDLEAFGTGYDTHKTTAEAFLNDLGATELARINEQFDNALAKNLQSLTDRGLYSSAIVTAITARVERERSEAITALNDRLAREELENEHLLWNQKVQLETTTLDGRLKLSQGYHQQGQFLVDVRTKCALTVMQSRIQRLQGLMDVRDKENQLMAYQLDTRNNLIVGLFGFMEKREDDGPSMQDITKLITGLGDSGGGWVTP